MKSVHLLLIALVLSGFTHLWNPVGYPDIFFDEGIYMRRAVHLLETGNPQESYLYDHPYFGQIVIASVLDVTNFLNNDYSSDLNSLQSLYAIPRIFMGLLAVLDTFLLYKIVQIRYGKNPAFLSSTLFAVLPFTWIFKRILLDSVLLPLVLGSILLALYSTQKQSKSTLIACSGILLGLAVFTKVPAFTMVFVVAWIVYTNRKKLSDVLLLLIPFVLIPMIWPTHAIMLDQFDLWQKDILWQTERTNSILGILYTFWLMDPLLLVIGFVGIGFAALRKDKFMLLWFAPYVIFLSVFGFKQYFHWMMIIPVMCMAASLMFESIRKLNFKKISAVYYVIISSVLIFGFVSTTALITTNVSENQFKTLSYVLENYDEHVTILASPTYSWILYSVFERENTLRDYSAVLFEPISSENTVLIADPHYYLDLERGPQLKNILDDSKIVKTFEGTVTNFDTASYPYTNIMLNLEASDIEIRELAKHSND